MRTRPRLTPDELRAELLPDLTRRCGRPIIYSSVEDRLQMEKLWRRLQADQHETRLAA